MSSLPPAVTENAGNNKTLEIIIGKAFLAAQQTCTSPWVLSFATNLPGTSITFHTLMKILAAIACIFNCSCAIYLATGHVLHWVRPDEQRQILRIILFDVVFSISAFFSIYFYAAAGYIHPAAVYYEGFAMTAIFLLFVQLVCPNSQNRAQFFTSLERRWMNGKAKKGSKGSLRWFRIVWICVFQITFTRIATLVAQEVIQSITCPLSKIRSTSTVVIQVIQGVSTTVTVTAVIVFERRMHELLVNHGHRPMLKLLSFKTIVWLEAFQDILFSALADSGVYFPTPPYHVSWLDFELGIPQLILALEMTLVSFAFLSAFSFEEYRRAVWEGHKVLAPSWKALLTLFNLSDIWQGVKYMFTCFTSSTYLEGLIQDQTPAGLDVSRDSGNEKALSSANDIR